MTSYYYVGIIGLLNRYTKSRLTFMFGIKSLTHPDQGGKTTKKIHTNIVCSQLTMKDECREA